MRHAELKAKAQDSASPRGIITETMGYTKNVFVLSQQNENSDRQARRLLQRLRTERDRLGAFRKSSVSVFV